MADFIVNSIDWLVKLEEENGKLGTLVGMLLVIASFITFASVFYITSENMFKFILGKFIYICWGVNPF